MKKLYGRKMYTPAQISLHSLGLQITEGMSDLRS